MTLMHERTMYDQLSQTESLPLSSNEYLVGVYNQVVADIQEGTKPYVEDLRRALDRPNRPGYNRNFNSDDFYISGRATSYRHDIDDLKISIISSAIENDPLKGHPMDDVIAYVSYYNLQIESVDATHDFITLSIRQNKLKPRIIHIACNAIQDRAKYIYRILDHVLSGLPTDCIRDQRSGIAFAMRVSNPVFRSEHNYPSIHCMDFSNATDLLSQEFQNNVLGLIFPPEVVKFWSDVSSMEKTFIFSDKTKKTYTQRRGQPQGLLGSIHAFAFAHHILMRMVMYITNRTDIRATLFYRVLGDDSIICSFTSDPKGEVRSAYKLVCEWAGLAFEDDKEHKVTYHDKKSALCEFAKVMVLNGSICTPVPIRLLSRTGKSHGRGSKNYYKLTTIMWMQANGYAYIKDELHRHLPKMFSEEAIPIASDMLHAGIIPAFKGFADYRPINPELLNKAMFCYLIEQLKGSFMSALLKDDASEDIFSEGTFNMKNLSPFLIPPERLQNVLDKVEQSNHKINWVLQRNLDLEDSLKNILGLQTEDRMIAGAVDLTDQEIRLYVWASDVLINLRYGEFPHQTREDWIDLLRGAASLDRFLPKSFHKKATRDIIFLEQAIQRLFILFPDCREIAEVS